MFTSPAPATDRPNISPAARPLKVYRTLPSLPEKTVAWPELEIVNHRFIPLSDQHRKAASAKKENYQASITSESAQIKNDVQKKVAAYEARLDKIKHEEEQQQLRQQQLQQLQME